MAGYNNVNQISQSTQPENSEKQFFKKSVTLIINRKYLFVGTLILCCLIAFLYNKYTIPFYRVSATILIEEEKKTSATGNDQLLEGFGLMPGMKNFDNQMMVLSSRTLVNKTLDELSIDTGYFTRGLINIKSLYPNKPIEIQSEEGVFIPRDVDFQLKYLGNDKFRLIAKSKGSINFSKKASFGERIEIPGGSIKINRKAPDYFSGKNGKTLYFTIHSRRNLVESYIRRLKVTRASKQGSIVKISLEGSNRQEDFAFLSKLSGIFLNISLERKNNEAIRTIQFIDYQLSGITDSLHTTENKLQQFRSSNKVMNISAQGQVIINQTANLENEKARLGVEANYYKYLSEYLDKDSVGEGPVIPSTMGISDPGLTKLVSDLADQESRLSSRSMGEKNPLQNQLTQKVKATRNSLSEMLKGLASANSLAMREIEEQINTVNSQAIALPRTEQQLLGIERKYKLNDELYTFLLEKRAMAQMQKASNVADNEMVDYPEIENKPIRPKKALIYLLALFTGFGFPFLWIFIEDIFNIRIRNLDEIRTLTRVSVLGRIPHLSTKKSTVVLDEPDSPAAESFRVLRSRMMFFTKENKNPVILVTSSMPEEGKTFTAINLASAYSLIGKRTILLGFDLRLPRIYSDFNLTNDKGLSTWLIGKNKLEEVICHTSYENLDIITSGPVPPNPAELTTLPRTNELIHLLKKNYDYIIIDSAPLGTVSDTLHLVDLCDTCILMIRQNFTIREVLENTLRDVETNKSKTLCIVINDVNSEDRHYSYGGKYGEKRHYLRNMRNRKSSLDNADSRAVPTVINNSGI